MPVHTRTWFEPCFAMVAHTPWYRPAGPSVFKMVLTPCMKGALVWMAFVLTVSMGVTAKIASSTPAPKPARNCSPELSFLLSLPASS